MSGIPWRSTKTAFPYCFYTVSLMTYQDTNSELSWSTTPDILHMRLMIKEDPRVY
jgi:hypothetical protein